MDVDGTIDELYALPREDFIAARAAKVKQARTQGDELGAKRLSRLRKPSVAAWLANQLAREHPAEIGELLELGGHLRRAHARLDGRQLQQLSKDRQRQVQGLRKLGQALAGTSGQPASEATLRQLEESLVAALADPEAAEALRAGRLESAGAGQTEWPASLVALAPLAAEKAPATEKPPTTLRPAAERRKPADGPSQQQRERLATAQKAAEHASTAVDVARIAADEAVQGAEEAAADVDRLRQELQAAREAQAQAAQDADTARRSLRQAERADQAADRELRAAELAVRASGG
ncbi:hypothetical protein [Fodinicola feengrottensis]|uniref:Transposase n=1 Tax=Fodinicola feengrottensis TaxID=435914 RepID=A0ABN2I2J4_9ACTN|nr:hypothetical protein [Fodinicola feengrottensis]